MPHDYIITVASTQRVSATSLSEEDIVVSCRATILDREDALDDSDPEIRTVGTVSFFIVNRGLAMNEGLNALDACDSVSQDVFEYGAAVLDAGGSIKEEVARQFECIGGDLMILHCATILPGHRGKNVGLVAARRIIQLYGRGLVVCRPQPLQHVGESESSRDVDPLMEYDRFKSTAVAAKRALRRHWECLGFQRIGASDFYALSTEYRLPSVELLDTAAVRAVRPRAPRPRRGTGRS